MENSMLLCLNYFLIIDFCGKMSLAEPCVYAEGSIRRKTHGDGSRRGKIK